MKPETRARNIRRFPQSSAEYAAAYQAVITRCGELERQVKEQEEQYKTLKTFIEGLSKSCEYDRRKRRHKVVAPKMRKQVLPWVDWRCMCCGRQFPCDQLHLDTVNAMVNGGDLTYDNVQVLCEECHRLKGERQGEEWDFRKNWPGFLEKGIKARREELAQLWFDFSRKYNPGHNDGDWPRHAFGPG